MAETPTSKRLRVIIREHYGVDLEYTDEVAVLHFPYFNKLTVSVLKELLTYTKDLNDLLTTIGFSEVWAAVDFRNVKMAKLITRLGFTYKTHINGLDVYIFEG